MIIIFVLINENDNDIVVCMEEKSECKSFNYDWMIEKWMFLQWDDEDVIGMRVWDDEWSDEDGCYEVNNESPAPSSQGLSATKCARQIEVDGTLDPRMQRWAALRQDMLILEFK